MTRTVGAIIEELARVERLDEGSMNVIQAGPNDNALVVEATGIIYKIELGAPLHPSREQCMWRHARRAGMPAPVLRRQGLVLGRKFVSYVKLKGSTPDPEDVALVVAGEALARLHATPPIGGYPVHQRARPRRLRRFEIALRSSKASRLPRWREYRDLIASAHQDWETRTHVTTHGDFRCANLLVTRGALSGVIDWSDGRLASREADLGGVDAPALPLVLKGYMSLNGSIQFPLIRGYGLARAFALWESSVVSDPLTLETVSILDNILREDQ